MCKILLISGHGGGDPGAIGTHAGVTYKEAELARELTSALKHDLEMMYKAVVDRYDTSRNAYYDYQNGSYAVDFSGYDYVLEVHFNAFVAGSDGKLKGTEIYVPSTQKDRSAATSIVEQIAQIGFPNRGVKVYNWAVISAVQRRGVNAALLEVCFIDDAEDMNRYLQNLGGVSLRIAAGLAEGLLIEEADTSETAMSAEEITIENAIRDIGMNSPDYWLKVLQGAEPASGANVKALMDKYHNALNAAKI